MRTLTLTFGLLLISAVAMAADSESRFGAKLEKPGDAMVDQLDLPKGQGLLLTKIKADSPAAKAGLKNNDVLLELGGKTVPNNLAELNKMMDDIKADAKISALVLRKGKKELVKDLTLPEGKKEDKKSALGKRPLPIGNPKGLDNIRKALEGLAQQQFPGADPDELRKMMDQLAGGKKVDPEALQKMLEKFGGGDGDGGDVDLEKLKKMREKLQGGAGKGDPEKLRKKIENLGGGAGKGIDPEQLKRMLEKFGGAGGQGFDAEKLKKLMEKVGGGGAGVDPEQLKKMLEQFGGGAGGFDAEKLRDLFQKKSDATPKPEEKKSDEKKSEEKKKLLDVRFFAPIVAVMPRFEKATTIALLRS